MGRALEIDVPRAFIPLLKPARYKGAHGGRGSGKSHFFASELVKEHVANPGMHSVCIREVQKSLAQSAKRTIETYIQKHRVGHLFDVQKAEIKAPGGGLIIFQGMQNHTAESIKSLEGYDRAWVEEAQTLSKTSLKLLRPTIRKPGSQIWFSWNPRKKEDPVDELLRGVSVPPNAAVIRANWQDNPWFHETALVEEMEFDRTRRLADGSIDTETYEHVWLGEYETKSEARVFKNYRVEWFEPPAGAKFYFGADWGFSVDPTVLVLCYIVGRTLYIWREVWQVGCEIDRTPALFDKIDPNWTPARAKDVNWRSLVRRQQITADSARPETISYMQRNGFPQMQAAVKGPGSVEDGIEFLKSYDIVIHPDCRHVADEFRRYAYKVEKHTGAILSELEDKENHTIDAVRYAVESVRRASNVSMSELRM